MWSIPRRPGTELMLGAYAQTAVRACSLTENHKPLIPLGKPRVKKHWDTSYKYAHPAYHFWPRKLKFQPQKTNSKNHDVGWSDIQCNARPHTQVQACSAPDKCYSTFLKSVRGTGKPRCLDPYNSSSWRQGWHRWPIHQEITKKLLIPAAGEVAGMLSS